MAFVKALPLLHLVLPVHCAISAACNCGTGGASRGVLKLLRHRIFPFLPGDVVLIRCYVSRQALSKTIHHPLFVLMTAHPLSMLMGMASGIIAKDSRCRFDTVFAR
ncbi:hypothetical protein KC333_g17 [Hortaea werneckii]|nr:hypothetical protein KC333_g17 [Hortaea werneckii]